MQKEQQQLQQAQSSYDDAEPWHLPIGHRVEDSLDTEGIAMASTDTAIPENNKGFQMLQKMGWKGTGLGRNENGENCGYNCCCHPHLLLLLMLPLLLGLVCFPHIPSHPKPQSASGISYVFDSHLLCNHVLIGSSAIQIQQS